MPSGPALAVLALLAPLALLAGCANPASFDGFDGTATAEDPALPGLQLRATMNESRPQWDFWLENRGPATYRVHDDCSQQWYGVRIVDEDGAQVVPAEMEAHCELYSVGFDLRPGQTLHGAFTWDGRDIFDYGDPRPAPPGNYVLHLSGIVDGHEPLRLEMPFAYA